MLSPVGQHRFVVCGLIRAPQARWVPEQGRDLPSDPLFSDLLVRVVQVVVHDSGLAIAVQFESLSQREGPVRPTGRQGQHAAEGAPSAPQPDRRRCDPTTPCPNSDQAMANTAGSKTSVRRRTLLAAIR